MNILHVIDSLGPGGAERHLLQVAGFLAKAGHGQRVLRLNRPDALAGAFGALGVPTASLSLRQGLWSVGQAARGVLTALRRERADVVVTHLPSSDIAGRLAARRLALPSVSVWQNTVYDFDGLGDRRWRVRATLTAYRILERASIGPRAAFIAVSKAVQSSYCRALGLPASRSELIENCFDAARAGAPAFRRPAAAGALRLLHLGRHVPQKNAAALLSALGRLGDRPGVTLDLVGSGPLQASLEEAAGPLVRAGRVRFLGQADEVRPHLDAADALVIASLREGLSLAYLEALASGLPVVASDIAANREVDPAGAATLFFDPRDPDALARTLRVLADDPGLRARMSAHAPGLLARFSVESVGARFETALRKALAG